MRRSLGHPVGRLILTVCLLPHLAGCQKDSEPPGPSVVSFAGTVLKVGAMGDTALLKSVSPLLGEWEASRRGKVSIRPDLVTPESISFVDVVLFPAQELGDLVDADALAVIPNKSVLPPKAAESASVDNGPGESGRAAETPDDPLQYMDIAPAYRDQISRYGSDRYALPCGGSALVLVYRRDAFEREANRAAARQAGLELKPPMLWPQLDALAGFFHGRDWDGDGSPDFGIALALGADNSSEDIGGTTFLARAASLGQHRDHYSFLFDSDSMAPRIDSPPFVEALRSLVALKASGPPGVERFDGPAAREAFRGGRVAMLLDRAECAATWSHGKAIEVAPLPASDRVFEPSRKEWGPASPPNAPTYLPRGGGWLIGIKRQLMSSQFDAAVDFVKYLASPENCNRIRAEPALPMLPVRISQMSLGLPDPTLAPDVDSRLWSDAVGRTLLAERIVPGLRIAGAGDYLKDLTNGRIAAVNGEDPEKALRAVAQDWKARTAARGVKRQAWHYQCSLNTITASSRPPERGK